ncbi:MAG: tetratricopeptide repeat protein, partial [Thiomicrorhabdus sp.]|nr:tetratricopeptide repeat protein [Thiomicrorhabdus sp.]
VTDDKSSVAESVEPDLGVAKDNDSLNSSSESKPDDLPIFNLQIDPVNGQNADEVQNPIEEDLAIDEVPEVRLSLKGFDESNQVEDMLEGGQSKDFDLDSLIDSLDVDDKPQTNSQNLSLSSDKHSEENKMDLKEQPVTNSFSVDTSSDYSAINENGQMQELDTSWGMENLPAYSEDTGNEKEGNNKPSSNKVNPVLLNMGNTSAKSHKKITTSSRLIVSLFVFLLFIGIGLYGMLYYQEQNENLEFSMKKYALSKMELPPSAHSDDSDSAVETHEKITPLNVVSNKVIEIGNSIKESVESNVVEPLTQVSQEELSTESTEKSDSILDQSTKELSEELTSRENEASELLQKKKAVSPTSKPVRAVTVPPVKKVTKRSQISDIEKNRILLTGSIKSDLGVAYNAYYSGDYEGAKVLFNKTLSKEPKNINALLGLGGIETAQGNYRQAINFYQKVLEIKPNNLYAFEAISNLSGHLELNKAWELELHEMALKYPNSAMLQYAKGNLYARKNDWLAAQESYFQAYVLDSKNPDYMMNLAVSFDHLGKYSMASEYYTLALAHSELTQIHFDKKLVKDRLISIRQFIIKGQ